MTRLMIAALCLLTAAHAQTIVGPAAGSTALTLPASTPATVSDSWLTVTPGAVAYIDCIGDYGCCVLIIPGSSIDKGDRTTCDIGDRAAICNF